MSDVVLTPQQEALNGQVCELPVIKNLQAKDDEIIEDLEGLKEGQDGLNKRLDKGTERMNGIEGKVQNLSDKFDSFLSMFSNHVQRTEQMHREIKDNMKDEKYNDLKEEKKALQLEIDEGKKRKWDIAKGIGLLVAGAIISGISVKLFG